MNFLKRAKAASASLSADLTQSAQALSDGLNNVGQNVTDQLVGATTQIHSQVIASGAISVAAGAASKAADAAQDAARGISAKVKSISGKEADSLDPLARAAAQDVGGTYHWMGHTPNFPIVLMPGFMSSGLEIVETKSKPDWEGKRVWMSLEKLAFSSAHLEVEKKGEDGDNQLDDEEDEFVRQQKNIWIKHMTLGHDARADREGIRVRAVPGLEGCNFLDPGAITSGLTYIFGPLIRHLRAVGYDESNMAGAPYDWRLDPAQLEARDGYFSATMATVNRLVARNGGRPVVIVAHSMGTKALHYFLHFAAHHSSGGAEWVRTHVHTAVMVGGPALGAPKSLRAVLLGDKMGLDTFLSDEEALVFGRRLGSSCWLLPRPASLFRRMSSVAAFAWTRDEGVWEVALTGWQLTQEAAMGRPKPKFFCEVSCDGTTLPSRTYPGTQHSSGSGSSDRFQLVAAHKDSARTLTFTLRLVGTTGALASALCHVRGVATLSVHDLLRRSTPTAAATGAGASAAPPPPPAAAATPPAAPPLSPTACPPSPAPGGSGLPSPRRRLMRSCSSSGAEMGLHHVGDLPCCADCPPWRDAAAAEGATAAAEAAAATAGADGADVGAVAAAAQGMQVRQHSNGCIDVRGSLLLHSKHKTGLVRGTLQLRARWLPHSATGVDSGGMAHVMAEVTQSAELLHRQSAASGSGSAAAAAGAVLPASVLIADEKGADPPADDPFADDGCAVGVVVATAVGGGKGTAAAASAAASSSFSPPCPLSLEDDSLEVVAGTHAVPVHRRRPLDTTYTCRALPHVMALQKLPATLRAYRRYYLANPLLSGPASDLLSPPPVPRVLCIYGVGLPTEVAHVYRRKSFRKPASLLAPLSNYALDTSARLPTEPADVAAAAAGGGSGGGAQAQAGQGGSGLRLSGGIMYETPRTSQACLETGAVVQRCGDGTVPYASLQYPVTWRQHGVEVAVKELPGAEHREILNDSRFHTSVLDYVCVAPRLLRLRVCRGRGLRPMDANGSSDPYACVRYGGRRFMSPVVPHSLEPAWDAEFALPLAPVMTAKERAAAATTGAGATQCRVAGGVVSPPATPGGASSHEAGLVVIEVWDRDLAASDEFMGQLVFTMEDLQATPVSAGAWYPLQPAGPSSLLPPPSVVPSAAAAATATPRQRQVVAGDLFVSYCFP